MIKKYEYPREIKTENVIFRLTIKEKKALFRMAQLEGGSISAFLRMLIEQYVVTHGNK